MLIDIDSKERDEVIDHLIKVVGKSATVLDKEAKQDNPAHFGVKCDRFCICEVQGQVPCPAVVPVPKHMRGKYKYAKE